VRLNEQLMFIKMESILRCDNTQSVREQGGQRARERERDLQKQTKEFKKVVVDIWPF
jgi:hypothetical protein